MAKNKGLGSSASKLTSLKFDPIEKMVTAYDQLCTEILFQEGMRDGTHHRLNKDGSFKQYSVDFHMGLVERAGNLAEKLMKYGYAPVKDEGDEGQNAVLNIHLSDQGGTFTLNPKREEADDSET